MRCWLADCRHVSVSAAFASPEGLNYFQKPEEYLITSATDVFSMGCVLFGLLCGLPAFGRFEDETLTYQQCRQQVLQRQALWVSLRAQ